MRWLCKLPLRLRSVFRKSRVEQELSDEIRFHLEKLVEENVGRGMTPDEAHYAALRELGGVEQIKEECRDMRRVNYIENFLQDVRYGLRMLRKSPGFTAVAVITLALGIGANSSVFSVVNGVLLRPLPYPEPDRLFSVQEEGGNFGNPTSYPDVADWRAQNRVFSSTASYHVADFTLTGQGEPMHLLGAVVDSDFLNVLQVPPILGRGFEPQDDVEGTHVVLLSSALWREKFHSDPEIVGRGIVLDRQSFTVVGVMPVGFQFPPTIRSDIWTRSAIDTGPPKIQRGYSWLSAIARLKPDVTPTKAQAEMNVIARRLARQYPETNAQRTSIRMAPELERVVGSTRLPLIMLLGVVSGVLLIACVNLANLSLARNLTREVELAVRATVSAGRKRLVGQLLTESVLLSLLGGLCGIVLAVWGTHALMGIVPQAIPRASEVGMDRHVLIFAILLSFVTGVLFGLVPALRVSRSDLVESLKGMGRSASEGMRHRRLRGALISAETALAFVLLAGAGLLIASYLRLLRTDPGFNPHNLLTFDFDVPSPPYTTDRALTFYKELLSRLDGLPDVESAVASWPVPLGGGDPSSGFDIEGRSFPSGNSPVARVHIVTAGYFHTLGIGVREGRDFTARDDMASTQMVIVDETFANTFFPNEDVIGKRIRPSLSTQDRPPWRAIVGVVGNTKLRGIVEDFQPQYYIPYVQLPGLQPAAVVRTRIDPLRSRLWCAPPSHRLIKTFLYMASRVSTSFFLLRPRASASIRFCSASSLGWRSPSPPSEYTEWWPIR